jgi:hypothetical protein
MMARLQMPDESRLPPGALRDMVSELHLAHEAAGSPSFRRLVDKIDAGDPRDAVSRETLSRMFRGVSMPRWLKVESVVRQLATLSSPERDPDREAARFLRLWNALGRTGPDEMRLPPIYETEAPTDRGVPDGAHPGASQLAFSGRADRVSVVFSSEPLTHDDGDYELRDSNRHSILQEREKLVGTLAAVLSKKYGPRAVVPKYESRIDFPGGTLMASDRSEIVRYEEGSDWFEVEVSVAGDSLAILHFISQELKNRALQLVRSHYEFPGQLDLLGVAQYCYDQGVDVVERTESRLAIEAPGSIGRSIVLKNKYGGRSIMELPGFEIATDNAHATLGELSRLLCVDLTLAQG